MRCVLLLLLTTHTALAAQGLADTLTAYDKWLAEADPIAAGQRGDLQAAARWPDDSPQAVSARQSALAQIKHALDAIPQATLKGEDALNYTLLEARITTDQDSARFDENRIPYASDQGFYVIPDYAAGGTALHTSRQAQAWLSRLATLPAFYATETANLERGIATGFVLPHPIAAAQAAAPPAAPRGEPAGPTRHEFAIPRFATESGVILPEARIVYGTTGTLNAARDNAVLLPSHYMADLHGYDWLIGPDHALHPDELFLVTTEMFGNGRSSSPSNTPEPLGGPRFPVTTIRDNVAAAHRLLTEHLGITHLRAVIGFSMGAQQALQWAVSHPRFMDRVVATAGTAKTYGHGIVRLDGQIAAITADAAFDGGNYTAQPVVGIRATALVWLGWLYSQEWWRQELWRDANPPGTTFRRAVDTITDAFLEGDDANNLIVQMRAWQEHDVGRTPPFAGDLQAALRSIQAPVLYMPGATDLYFPADEARDEARFIPRCTFLPIPSLWGHPAGAGASPPDATFINDHVAAFMAA